MIVGVGSASIPARWNAAAIASTLGVTHSQGVALRTHDAVAHRYSAVSV
jgi:hypothetical protein